LIEDQSGAKAMSHQENAALPQKGSKKPYRTPNLHEYGNIQEITQAVGFNGAPDNETGKGKHETMP
jgi:hypothetical protein